MSRARNPYRRAGSWVSGTGWTGDPGSGQAQDAPVPDAKETTGCELRWGYTIADIDRIARASVVADRVMVGDITHRYDTAWSAIAEEIYAVEEYPEWQHLVRVGWNAIYREVRDARRQRGYSDSYDGSTCGNPDRPRFVQYWGPRCVPSHEDAVVERIGVRQMMAVLVNHPQREAIFALAAHDDYVAAAAALGIRYSALTVRLSAARRLLASAWFGDETPARVRRTDRRVESHGSALAATCGRGHEWTPENTRTRYQTVRGQSKTSRTCRQCERERDRKRNGRTP